MRLTPLILTSALCFAGLTGCHNRSDTYGESPRDSTYTRSGTITTSAGTVVGSSVDTMVNRGRSSDSMAARASATASMRSEKATERAERREVHEAIRSLHHARYELEHAKHDYGGRRADALKAVDEALRDLRLATGEEAVVRSVGDSSQRGEQAQAADRQDLRQAIVSLERARNDMEHAGHDYGGRKAAALKSTEHALHELRLAAEHEK